MVFNLTLSDIAVRNFVSFIPQWGIWHSAIDALDLIVVTFCYFHLRPNPTIELLFYLTCCRSINIIMFYAAADYSPDYSYLACSTIVCGLEFGWIIFDNVNTLSTLQRALVLYLEKFEKRLLATACSVFVTSGVVLRILR